MYSQLQQYQQPQSAISSNGSQWNGSSWVSNPAHVQTGTYSTSYYSPGISAGSATGRTGTAIAPDASIPSNPVVSYTNYYHGWQAIFKQQEQLVGRMPVGSAGHTEAQNLLQWAKYYSDQSSRAAHFFYQNPNATAAPFDLPPAPDKYNQQGTAAKVTPNPSFTEPSARRQMNEENPNGLNRYVQSCLDQCTSEDQRKEMDSAVQNVIAQALTDGTFHTKNWQAEPLLRLPGSSPTYVPQHQPVGRNKQKQFQQAQMNSNFRQNLSQAGSPASRASQRNSHSKDYEKKLSSNDSYYGPSSASASPKGQALVSNDSYYGPSSAGSPGASKTSFGRRSSNQSDKSYGSNHEYSSSPSFLKANSSFSGQTKKKRSPSGEDNFIPFHPPQHRSKKQKTSNSGGFERSTSALAKRADRFKGPGGILDASSVNESLNGSDRFMGKGLIGGSQKKLDEQDFESMTVKGTCQRLEKEYLRLTAPPRAELVRPKPVLERHLANLKAEHVLKEPRHDYLWFCSQLKAVRQDCTIQRLKVSFPAFVIDVYETHARIALEEGDLNEYNQCQTQLKELYEIQSKTSDGVENIEEFLAYRMLYYVFLSTNESYDGGSSDLLKIMLSLTSDQMKHPAISHACKVREAVVSGDYLSFFRLHTSTPNLGRCLTSRIVPTMRFRALQRITKAYRPSLELSFCLQQLGFVEESSVEEGRKWMEACGCVLEGSEFMTKDSVVKEPQAGTKNSLI